MKEMMKEMTKTPPQDMGFAPGMDRHGRYLSARGD